MEIPYGPFARFVRLPREANVDRINAKYENGYLTIEIPRNQSHERR
jgi:HSP20 family molecular chaperone IbpA